MIGRVTNQTMMRSASLNLQANMAKLASLQDTASSQKAISRPSDDPIGTAAAMRIRADQSATTQYGKNIADGDAWLTSIDSAMSSTINLTRKVRDLTVQAGNPSLTPAARSALAGQLDSLKDELLNAANTTYLGRSVFAGTSGAAAFDATYTYSGTGAPVERRIGADSTVRVDADGAAVFGTGQDSVFALIDGIASDLRAGLPVTSKLTDIDTRMAAMSGEHAVYGARQASIHRASDANLATVDALAQSRSKIEDIDLGQVILDLQTQQVAYQAALSVTSKVLQPTLMDFLR